MATAWTVSGAPAGPTVCCGTESLDIGMSHLSTSLRSESAKYRKAARNINLQAMIRKYAPIAGIGLFVIIFLYWRFF